MKGLKIFWFVTLALMIERTMSKFGLINHANDYVDIDKNLPGGENMGGITQEVIFGKWEDVAQWPTAPVAPATVEANAAWTGDLVMKPGKRAFRLYVTDDAGEFKISPVGEVDGKSYNVELTIFNPGLKKKVLGFMNSAKNDKLFFIPTDAEGQHYLMGDAKRAAVMTGGEAGTGKETSSRKGASLTFSYKTPTLRVYEGDTEGLLEISA